jgi:D-arabinose 1-dehydrogenase-like Zn-dependent alcohol dehydrogenase
VDGELPNPKLPITPGHEIVGRIDGVGPEVPDPSALMGLRVGVPWLGYTCGVCEFCCSGKENLCDNPKFTGYQVGCLWAVLGLDAMSVHVSSIGQFSSFRVHLSMIHVMRPDGLVCSMPPVSGLQF